MGDIFQEPIQTPTVTAIEAVYKARGDAEERRRYLGGSAIGAECDRALWYSFRHCSEPEFPGRLYRLFQTGHLEEPRMVQDLRDIGVTVSEVDDDGEQYGVKALGGHFGGHMDGVGIGLPEAEKTWHVLEFKTHCRKSFEKLRKQGVEKSKLQHFVQCQIYMSLNGLTRALYLAKCKDTDRLYSERISLDKAVAERYMDRARYIIEATDPPPRVADKCTDFRCSFCDAKALCWGLGDVAVPVPSISCRQCCHATPEIVEGSDEGLWTCRCGVPELEDGHPIPPEIQDKGCPNHLFIPGLVNGCEPIDGDDQNIHYSEILDRETHEFWQGPRPGAYPSVVLAAIPWALVSGDNLADNPHLRYPAGDCHIVWEGVAQDLADNWYNAYAIDIKDDKVIQSCSSELAHVAEFDKGRLAFIDLATGMAEIREGKE